jgi:hypothetical protein
MAVDEQDVLPPQWKAYLQDEWLVKDRQGFIEHIDDLEENADWEENFAQQWLDMNNYELYLKHRDLAEEKRMEAEYMRSLL